MTDIRSPAVAGQFYRSTSEELKKQVEESFAHSVGPQSGPRCDKEDQRLHGAVVPHAGLPFSGPVAAHSYNKLAQCRQPDTIVIIGPNHRGGGSPISVAPHEKWRTPFGEVSIDQQLRNAVIKQTAAEADPIGHTGEHSVEIQLPFIQYIVDSEIQILPIVLSDQSKQITKEFGENIVTAATELSKDITILASTDFTHYQPHERAAAADKPVIKAISNGDIKNISQKAQRGHSMCGPGAVIAMLAGMSEQGVSTGTVEKYATSGDTAGSKDDVVGYASITFTS